ncbi:MAG: ATP-binding protein [Anaerovoracaceae bacterium]
MKQKSRTIVTKLWCWFILFAAIILAVLWLIQTVFLQSFYFRITVSDLEKTAAEIAGQKNNSDFLKIIEASAEENSLLIFLVDYDGNIVYSADEYSSIYGNPYHVSNTGTPYFSEDNLLSWQKGAARNLPSSHKEVLNQLLLSESTSCGCVTADNSAYVYGYKLTDCRALDGKNLIMCISMPLAAIDSAVHVLRIQLVWVSVFSLLLAAVLAFFISKRFEKPINHISCQAEKISRGEFRIEEKKGFCREFDELSDSLSFMANSLERLENIRRDLLANISHDLRTPLTLIKGYAEMIDAFSWSDEKQRTEDLAVIRREADRLTSLVNEILEYTSGQNSAEPVKKSEINISNIVNDTIQQFEPLCEKLGYRIEHIIEPGLWILGNEHDIERVIYNFIDNAVSHTDDSRHIRVTLERLNDTIRFSVKDYGPGISSEDIPYIWDRYYTSRNRKNGQTVSGLGLSISKTILTEHDADFGVENDNGCIFWFAFPQAYVSQK